MDANNVKDIVNGMLLHRNGCCAFLPVCIPGGR